MAQRIERPDVPDAWLSRIGRIFDAFPEVTRERAWVGDCWRVRRATITHVFGGEDQLFRITFRAEPDEVLAFENLGSPYFRAGWGGNVVGLILDEHTDWQELAELLTDSYCLQAPAHLAERVVRPQMVSPRDAPPASDGARRPTVPASGSARTPRTARSR